MHRFIRLTITTLFFLAISYGISWAQVVFTTNEAQFNADNPGLASQDFAVANAPAGGFLTCNAGIVDTNTNDTCFSPGEILPGIAFSSSNLSNSLLVLGSNAAGAQNPANVLTNNTFADAYEIYFSGSNTTAVGMILGCAQSGTTCSGNLTVNVFGAGDVLLNSTLIPVSNLFNSFLGVTSIVPITRIELPEIPALTDVRGLLSIRFGAGSVADLISLSPEFATNDILTDHTVTATLIANGVPVQGVPVDFEVTSGPNEGQASDPGNGECVPDDCTTDSNGQVSWTYTGGIGVGTDTIVASIVGGDSLTAQKQWVAPTRPIPTLSEWGMIAAAAGLGLVGVWFAMRNRKARTI